MEAFQQVTQDLRVTIKDHTTATATHFTEVVETIKDYATTMDNCFAWLEETELLHRFEGLVATVGELTTALAVTNERAERAEVVGMEAVGTAEALSIELAATN